MQRSWTDPRDRREWLVTVSPFGAEGRSAAVSFHRPGRMPSWTHLPGDEVVGGLSDHRLMDLLDQARGRAVGALPFRRSTTPRPGGARRFSAV